MQISRLYSNLPNILSPIGFNHGANADRLNIVLGEVKHPKDRKKDSHNLGKTTLLQLIDFLMLKGWSQDSFLYKHRDRFADFVFYLEIALNGGGYATIRRSVAAPTRVALSRHEDPDQNFDGAADDVWDHPDLPIDEAIKLLDAWLDLRALQPYDYRKAITYFLRSQGDWSDELQLQKFQAGRDLHWKPFVAHLFGFNQNPITRKYELDERIAKLQEKQAEQQSEVQFKEEDLPKLTAELGVLYQHVEDLEGQLDAFRFDDEERRIMRELVDTIEDEIASLNQQIYDARYDIGQIDSSLSHKDKFDLGEVQSIFDEAKLHFPTQLKKQYGELVEFKKKVTQERNAALRKRRKELEVALSAAEDQKTLLDARRVERLKVLRSTDTFEKFKALQKDVTQQKAQLVYLGEQRKKLEAVAETARQVREAERDRGRVVDEIKAMLEKPTVIYERFARIFNEYCQKVLSHEGIFFFHINSNNNLDYKISLGLAGQKGVASSQGEGTSYKKLICALFDLALLRVYEDIPFFHFVYHDGMFEALDDRKKLAFLELVREQVSHRKLQYIMTVIASDLPRDSKGKLVAFADDEIVLRLDDSGQAGRLFKMAEF
ncbi:MULTISPECIES: DUF2326 domain-containing protein [Agrobacterium]|uniref:DUF2326 domain-containing protein n=1 Tax=Agrobacterium TaxID=357 RepID=UPI000B3F79A3|nr:MULTISPECIES: DUF2326 domain-containing protein [Agrobacterium]MBP2536315.1 uncharacterized protein YydD (DUF2326 family) [Agrobacterium tumefaciens]MBP2573500.1 uncharacterized protein YydD (DUF2326 family) [Agrobacterium tumefaciens]MDP9791208.1 uncharacterized protein YydD (DUF2326 family) [Agrobacterium tumefaciens]NSY04606.1 DUF2326 domain-containing protein [Agrobacterium tumefaciens]OVE86679.1 hypothetical protein B7W89_25565 [Agrobacterium tumefaciens]